ncbi:hypothetical protein LX32DRAFT_656507 [Colletotrichum zoysiae]|uniref:Uncharacterized protein n=1 Tax=Colletotrichum zoysiae TaxID=1216348 RepID=A0AAD9H9J7_9PEZI|nr:hypothetical protein LX32DRAFT_656507 [Colletotrichum zoysiae]
MRARRACFLHAPPLVCITPPAMIAKRLPTLPAGLQRSYASLSALLPLVLKSRYRIFGTIWVWLPCASARGDGMACFRAVGSVIAKSGVQDSQEYFQFSHWICWTPSATEARVAFPDSPWSNSFRRRTETVGRK